MRPSHLLIVLLCTAALPACKTTRTVLSGPPTTDLGTINDYNPQRDAASLAAAQKAASMGMAGTPLDSGGSGWGARFGSKDPYGYVRPDPNDKEKDPAKRKMIYGLNAMADKYYGGNTASKDMKSFSQTKDFLTKRYANTGEIGQKESYSQRLSSWLGGKKARTDAIARETGQDYRDGAKVVANKANYNDGRTLPERSSREDGRTASTKDFYPAKKVLEQGADAPKLIGTADKTTADTVTKFVKSRSRDNPATVEEIRQMLAKDSEPGSGASMVTVVCPFCFQEFGVTPPSQSELPAEWDYDCEICCRPMIISFEDDGEGDALAEARSLAE